MALPETPTNSDRMFGTALAAIVLTHLLLFAYYLGASKISVPFWDMLDFVDSYMSHAESGRLLTYLWLPDNEHHSLWSRLLTVIDLQLFDGAGYAFQIFTTSCLVSAPILVWRELRRSALDQTRSLAGGAVVLMLFLTVPAAVDCSVPMNGAYPQAVGFMVMAVTLQNSLPDRFAWRNARQLGATLAAIGSSFGNAVGLLTWPVLLWLAWQHRLSRKRMAALAGSALVFLVFYLRGTNLLSGSGVAGLAGKPGVVKGFEYAVSFLGLPWTRSATLEVPSRLWGCLLLLLGLGAVLRFALTRGSASALERLAISLILFSLGAAVMATLGRGDLAGEVAVPVRYTVLVAPLEAGLACLALERSNRRGVTREWLFRPCFLGGALLLLAAQIPAGFAAEAASRAISRSVDRFLAGERDQARRQVVYPDVAAAARIFSKMREHGLYRWMW